MSYLSIGMYYLANIPVDVYYVQLSLLYYLFICYSAIGMFPYLYYNILMYYLNTGIYYLY